MVSSEQRQVTEAAGAYIQRKHKPHFAFLFTDGFAARMTLRSGVAKRLIAQGSQVTVISPNAHEPYFQQECQQEGVVLQQEHGDTSRIAEWFRTYRPYFLDDVIHNPALRTKHIRLRADRPIIGFAMEIINKTLAHSNMFRTYSRHFERMMNRSSSIKKFLNELRPDFLILPNPFGSKSTLYLLHARELGIPVICQMLSWDNVTTKGTPLLMPDYFISWGPIMTEEILNIYHFSKEKIYECGVPHFDVYAQKDKLISREVLLNKLQLPHDIPYIFYGMVAELYCPNELDILQWLSDKVNNNSFCKPCSLVIRPHPLTISGFYASSNEKKATLQSLVGPRVALDIPRVLSERLAWDLPKEDMYRLASVLAESAVCLNAGSTLCLDACMLDRPVINISFDGWEELPYERSARRALDCTHIAKLLALGGVRVAQSFPALEEHINSYLCNPHLDHTGRVLSATQECGPQDGQAAERVVTTLLRLTDGSYQG